jgi:thiosulfate dehydrogenase [quinone] large subunit
MTTTQMRPHSRTSTEADRGRPIVASVFAARALAVLRIAYGFTFLWAFFDKLFGWGYATPSAKSWINGGDPTAGFLKGAEGPFADFYHGLVGDWWVTPLFMIALAGIGLALTLGIGMRIAAVSGTVLYLMMFGASLPLTTNPVLDDHILGALTLIVLAATAAGTTWGLGKVWSSLGIVRRYGVLK